MKDTFMRTRHDNDNQRVCRQGKIQPALPGFSDAIGVSEPPGGPPGAATGRLGAFHAVKDYLRRHKGGTGPPMAGKAVECSPHVAPGLQENVTQDITKYCGADKLMLYQFSAGGGARSSAAEPPDCPASAEMGEMLAATERAEGTRSQLRGRKASGGISMLSPEHKEPTLAEIGLSKRESAEAIPATGLTPNPAGRLCTYYSDSHVAEISNF